MNTENNFGRMRARRNKIDQVNVSALQAEVSKLKLELGDALERIKKLEKAKPASKKKEVKNA